MKLGRMFLKLAVVALGIFCAFLISACVQSSSHTPTWEVSSCTSCISTNKGLGFTLNPDGESYSLSFVGKEETKVVVPAEFRGKPVTRIASGTFIYYRLGGMVESNRIPINLNSLTLPDTITRIADGAFSDRCPRAEFENIYYKGSLEQWCKIKFGEAPFTSSTKFYINNELLTELTIPESITEIGANTFRGYDKLKKVNFHNGVVRIGDSAFRACGLQELNIPDSVTALGGEVFNYCSGLKEVSLGEGVTEIPYRAFANCSALGSIILPTTLESIGAQAFEYCAALKSADVGGANDIGEKAFYKCVNLSSVTFSGNLKKIGIEAFNYCEKIESITLPEDLEEIGDWALSNTGVESLTIPASTTKIGVHIVNGTVEDITVAAGNMSYRISGGCLIEIKTRTLIKGSANSVIPDDGSVTTIGRYAFAWSGIVSVVVPESVIEICGCAFYRCSELTTMSLPKSLKEIGYCVIDDCDNLETINYAGTHSEWDAIRNISSWTDKTVWIQASDERFEG